MDPKPIDGADLLNEVIAQIKDVNNEHRKNSLNFFIYNVLPGTTSAAVVKADFLKDIVLEKVGKSRGGRNYTNFCFGAVVTYEGRTFNQSLVRHCFG